MKKLKQDKKIDKKKINEVVISQMMRSSNIRN